METLRAEQAKEKVQAHAVQMRARFLRWKKYILATLPTVWFWVLLVVVPTLGGGGQALVQMVVDTLFWSMPVVILALLTNGHKETSWRECLTVWIGSIGGYVILATGVIAGLMIGALGGGMLVKVGIEPGGLVWMTTTLALLLSVGFLMLKGMGRWTRAVRWWGETVRVERSLVWMRWAGRGIRRRVQRRMKRIRVGRLSPKSRTHQEHLA